MFISMLTNPQMQRLPWQTHRRTDKLTKELIRVKLGNLGFLQLSIPIICCQCFTVHCSSKNKMVIFRPIAPRPPAACNPNHRGSRTQPYYRGRRYTLTSEHKVEAALLCELPPKRHGNSHSAHAGFEPASTWPAIHIPLPLHHPLPRVCTVSVVCKP